MSLRGSCGRRRIPFKAFTVVELLVVIAIIGVMTAILLPAVNAVRLSAQRNSNLNNVSQITKAILIYEQAKKTLPPLVHQYDPAKKGPAVKKDDAYYSTTVSWAFMILPYLEEQNLFDRLDITKTTTDPANRQAMASPMNVFANPIRRDATNLAPFLTQSDNFGASLDYSANGGVIVDNSRKVVAMPTDPTTVTRDYPYGEKFDASFSGPFHRDIAVPLAAVKDGVGNTICIGDRWLAKPTIGPRQTWVDLAGMPGDSLPTLVRYGNPDNTSVASLPFPVSVDDPSILKFGGFRGSDACFGFLDGRATYIQYSIDPLVMQYLSSIYDRQHVPPLN